MNIYLSKRMGKSRENPALSDIELALDELLNSNDQEHNSISLSNEDGYYLEIYAGGKVILENLENAEVKQLQSRVLKKEIIRDFIKTFISGNISKLKMDIISYR
jgi:hypothetical protein